MCGIIGIIGSNIRKQMACSIPDILNILSHRGPDSMGYWDDENALLVHNRLAIVDLSVTGNQPMHSHCGGYVLTYNGELYNCKELALKHLAGIQFRGHSDTEILLELLVKKGISILPELNGIFAFGLWNKHKKELLVVRDQWGVKPLYYCFNNNHLIIASEIKAILCVLGKTPPIDAYALENYFTFCHNLTPRTIYKNIYKLPPAHYAVFQNGELGPITRYWESTPTSSLTALNKMNVLSECENLLRKAVRRQFMSDVEVGVFLSGGVDSSGLVAISCQEYRKRINTFSVGFEFAGFNELPEARLVANQYHTEHHEIVLSDKDLIPILDKIVYHYDEPFGDAAAFPTFLLSQFAAKYVKVVLSGEGSDEIFGGYNRYVAEKYINQLQKISILKFCSKLFAPVINSLPRIRRFKKIISTMNINSPYLRYGEMLSFFNISDLERLLNRSVLHDPRVEAYENLWRTFKTESKNIDQINWLLYADQNRWMHETYLEKVDKASMAVSLETRVPFLDIELVTYMNNISGNIKIQNNKKKAILRTILKKYLPPEIIDKPKHGFSVPTDLWFRTKLNSFYEDLISDKSTGIDEIISVPFAKELLKKHIGKQACYDSHLWLIMMFCLWFKRFKPSLVS